MSIDQLGERASGLLAATVAAAVLYALLAARAALFMRSVARLRSEATAEVERRRRLGLQPVQVRVEAGGTDDRVTLGWFHGDLFDFFDPQVITSSGFELVTSEGRRFAVDTGTEVLSIGMPTARQKAAGATPVTYVQCVSPDVRLWALLPSSTRSDGRFDSEHLGRLEISESREAIDIRVPPSYRPRISSWLALALVLVVPAACPFVPVFPPAFSVVAAIAMIGMCFPSLFTLFGFEADDDRTRRGAFVRLMLRPMGPWPIRFLPVPPNRGSSPGS